MTLCNVRASGFMDCWLAALATAAPAATAAAGRRRRRFGRLSLTFPFPFGAMGSVEKSLYGVVYTPNKVSLFKPKVGGDRVGVKILAP